MLKILFIFLMPLLLVYCESKPKAPAETTTTTTLQATTTSTTTTLPETDIRISLSWENSKASASWSDEVIKGFEKNFTLFTTGTDFKEVCPKFDSLSHDEKLKALGEFWVAVAYHESSFNPKSYSVDVGNKNNKCSWSIGLYQLSCTDGSNIENLTFEQMQDPLKNIRMSIEQIRRQITKTKKYLLDNSSSSRYWAVILKGNKYSQISDIKSRTLKYSPSCKL